MDFNSWFTNLHIAWKIVILVHAILAALYILLLIFVSWRILLFRKKLKDEIFAIQFDIIEERRVLIDMHDYLKFKLKINKFENSELFDEIISFSIAKINSTNYLKFNQTISSYKKGLFKAIDGKKIEQDPQIQKFIFAINDINSLRRKKIVLYNADCNVYNYWRNFKSTQWIFDVFRVNKVTRIN